MVYRLHYYPANANAAPHMCLNEISAPYELALVDRTVNAQKSPEYLKLNPNGRIPVLEDGSMVLFEAAAIVMHLVDKHPEANLAPGLGDPERSKFYQWLFYLTNSLQEELMIWQYPERLVGDAADATYRVKSGAETRAERMLDVIEAHLKDNGPHFLGARFSAVDLYFVMLARWARPMTRPPRSRPHVARLLDLVLARDTVKRAYEQQGITDQIC
jgi:glutathione S-transferase